MTQREFKFRVWDKKIQSMQNHDWLFAAQVRYDALFKVRDDICVMQWTGLKDSKDNLIFEGDILKYHFEDDTVDYMPVYFKDGSFMTGKRDDALLFDDLNDFKIEVAGNIYEHAHLLQL